MALPHQGQPLRQPEAGQDGVDLMVNSKRALMYRPVRATIDEEPLRGRGRSHGARPGNGRDGPLFIDDARPSELRTFASEGEMLSFLGPHRSGSFLDGLFGRDDAAREPAAGADDPGTDVQVAGVGEGTRSRPTAGASASPTARPFTSCRPTPPRRRTPRSSRRWADGR